MRAPSGAGRRSPAPSPLLQEIRQHGGVPRHVAVVMDGNGRWARERGRSREFGHRAGMVAVRGAVRGALDAGVQVLTLFAFSLENWQRPAGEVAGLMSRLELQLRGGWHERLRRMGVELRVMGDLGRLGPRQRAWIERGIAHTRGGARLTLNLALSYGGRAEIARAARSLAERVERGTLTAGEIDEALFSGSLYTAGLPDPDLLIRTSGEQRISNFLLWQIAYAELYFTPVLWPEFTQRHFYEAIREYQRRERRFGRIAKAPHPAEESSCSRVDTATS